MNGGVKCGPYKWPKIIENQWLSLGLYISPYWKRESHFTLFITAGFLGTHMIQASIKVVESEEVQKEAVKVCCPSRGEDLRPTGDGFGPRLCRVLHNVHERPVHWVPCILMQGLTRFGALSHRVQVKELFPDRTIFAGVGLICADMLRCGGSMLLMHDLHWFC